MAQQAAPTAATCWAPPRRCRWAVAKEAAALIDLSQHPNIVCFIGVCVEPPYIVLEYYAGGCLFDLVHAAR